MMHHRAKARAEIVRKVRAEHVAYITSYATLAKKYGVSAWTIRDWVTYRTRRDVI